MQSYPTMNHLPPQPTMRHDAALDGAVVIDIMGVGLQRVFMVWNRSYRPALIVAPDAASAKDTAILCKHMRRPTATRRFEDVTERALAGDEQGTFGSPDVIAAAVAMDKPGMIVRVGSEFFLVNENRVKLG